MSDIESVAPASAGTGEGIAPASGQAGDSAPAGSVSTQAAYGEQPRPSEAAQTPEQAPETVNSDFGWKTLQDAERDHKALQRAYTKGQQAYAQLGHPQQVAQQLQILNQLREHPEFISWVQGQLAKETAGSNDPDTVRALEIVQKEARREIQQAMAPLQAAHVAQKMQTVFSELEKEYGPEWQQLKPKMGEILNQWKQQGYVSPQVEQNFDYSFVKGLYAAAAAADPAFAAKAYQKRLEQKQANVTTSQPGTAAAAVAPAQSGSIRDAFAQAKRQLGIA